MKLPDANLLIYSFDVSSPHHARSRIWLETLMSGVEQVGFSWMVILAFLRISTGRVFSDPYTPAEALAIVDGWLSQPCAVVLHPTERHAGILRSLLEGVGTSGNLTMDAHLAALAIEYSGEVFSADSDFRRFVGLRWTNPLT